MWAQCTSELLKIHSGLNEQNDVHNYFLYNFLAGCVIMIASWKYWSKSTNLWCTYNLQALYGRKTQTDIGGVAPVPSVPRVTTQQPSAEDPALCADPNIDTIFNSADGNTFVFKGNCFVLTNSCSFYMDESHTRDVTSGWNNIFTKHTYVM